MGAQAQRRLQKALVTHKLRALCVALDNQCAWCQQRRCHPCHMPTPRPAQLPPVPSSLQAAFMVMQHIGGKMLLFQASAPSVGVGKVGASLAALLNC